MGLGLFCPSLSSISCESKGITIAETPMAWKMEMERATGMSRPVEAWGTLKAVVLATAVDSIATV